VKIILATGIYPPNIGGPATYVRNLAEELVKKGHDVTVITYADRSLQGLKEPWEVVRVPKSGGPLLRWRWYAQALKQHATNADIVECFSSVSCGVPLKMAKLKKPKKILRLGGDFTWERYTDLGRRRSLRGFMAKHPRLRFPMARLLKTFDHIVFSTRFQEDLYTLAFSELPRHSFIENALPALPSVAAQGTPVHQKHDPMRLLYFGRFVKFKNLDRLLNAVAAVPHVTLTMVGEGPERDTLQTLARTLQLGGRVSIVPSVHSGELENIFAEHDLLVIPSLTEISPNSALESRASGFPVLLTEENGLSAELRTGMMIRPLLTVNDITKAVLEVDHQYDQVAQAAAAPFMHVRGWDKLADEHIALFESLVQNPA
ncbi:glycosyltransferase, partial [Candidatus Peribacteria bacterium]|nr:glycosyltransferase [Candidatus Peribacteria bacterium]